MLGTMKRPQPGETLETSDGRRARVEGWRAEGSFAVVMAAEDLLWGDRCAVKWPKTTVNGWEACLDREREVLSRVKHARVVALRGEGNHHGVPFLILEWLDGGTLEDRFRQQKLGPVRPALDLLEQVAEGLAAIHATGLVHGDLRPHNVVLAERGAVLIDPGGTELRQWEADIRAAGAILTQAIFGTHRVPTARGHGLPGSVVALWESLHAARTPDAAELLSAVRQSRAAL